MKPTQEQAIAWALEAGWTGIYSQWISPTEREHLTVPVTQEQIEAAFALAYEAGRKDENEACAELIPPQYFELRDRIRARREQ